MTAPQMGDDPGQQASGVDSIGGGTDIGGQAEHRGLIRTGRAHQVKLSNRRPLLGWHHIGQPVTGFGFP